MTGHEVVSMARNWLRRYAVLSPAQNLVLALWALHTHVYAKLSRTTPYVEITGVSGSGKTTTMEAILLLSRGGLKLDTIRVLAMCRYITAQNGEVTLGIDEAERLSSTSYGDQRSMLASGYREGGQHMVTEGKEAKLYGTWCPKLFTSTCSMTPVLHNRAIPIWCEIAKPQASLSLERERAEATSAEIVDAFQQLAAVLAHPVSMVPDWLTSERDIEIWTPLFTLARTLRVSDETMQELIAASVDLSALRGIVRQMDARVEDEAAKERSYAVRLLADVQSVLRDDDLKVIPTSELLERLRKMSTGPWRHYRGGLHEHFLAQLMGAHGIAHVRGQRGTGKTRTQYWGYNTQALRDKKP